MHWPNYCCFFICPVEAGVRRRASRPVSLCRVMNDAIPTPSCYGYHPPTTRPPLCSPCLDQLNLLRLNKLFSPHPEKCAEIHVCCLLRSFFIHLFFVCWLSGQRAHVLAGAPEPQHRSSCRSSAGRQEDALPYPRRAHRACRPRSSRLDSVIALAGSIVLAIGSLLTIIQKRSPSPRRSTMSNKSRGVEHGCGALTATQKRGNLGERGCGG